MKNTARRIDGKKLDVLRRIIEQDTFTQQQETGKALASVTYVCDWPFLHRLMPRKGKARHPDFNMLIATGSVARRMKDGTAEIVTTYEGTLDPSSAGGTSGASPVVEVLGSTSDEPIETHKRFYDIAGNPFSPNWPGVYTQEDDGGYVFNKFPAKNEDGDDCEYFGMESYLAPRRVVRRTSIVTNRPDTSDVGKLEEPPTESGITGLCLKTTHEWKLEGGTYTETEEWLVRVDDRDWPTYVYEEA